MGILSIGYDTCQLLFDYYLTHIHFFQNTKPRHAELDSASLSYTNGILNQVQDDGRKVNVGQGYYVFMQMNRSSRNGAILSL